MRYAIPPLFLLLRIVGRREKKEGRSAWLARSGAPVKVGRREKKVGKSAWLARLGAPQRKPTAK